MEEFVSIEILGTIGGCSLIITLLTQAFKRYLPEKIDTKWLTLIFSVIVGALRMVYVGELGFAGIVSGIFNIVVLLSTSVGFYEIGKSVIENNSAVVDDNDKEVEE